MSRFTLRVVATAGARGNSPVYRRVQTVRVLLSVRIADARRGTKGMNPKTPKRFEAPFGGLLEASRSAGEASFNLHLFGMTADLFQEPY